MLLLVSERGGGLLRVLEENGIVESVEGEFLALVSDQDFATRIGEGGESDAAVGARYGLGHGAVARFWVDGWCGGALLEVVVELREGGAVGGS